MLAAKQVLIVTNDRIAPLYLEKVKKLVFWIGVSGGGSSRWRKAQESRDQ
jgi:hypothetical protein